MENNKSFFEPVITLLGIVASLTVSLSPLFTQTQIDKFFVDKTLVVPSSILAFLLSSISIWIGLTQPYINFPYFAKQPWNSISNRISDYFRSITTFGFTLLAISIYIFSKFIELFQDGTRDSSISQSIFYISFFVIVSYLFAILFKQSKSKYEYDLKKQELPSKIRALLENHGQIENNFKIIDILDIGVFHKLVHIKIEKLDDKDLFVVINGDSSEFYRTLTKAEATKLIKPPPSQPDATQ